MNMRQSVNNDTTKIPPTQSSPSLIQHQDHQGMQSWKQPFESCVYPTLQLLSQIYKHGEKYIKKVLYFIGNYPYMPSV